MFTLLGVTAYVAAGPLRENLPLLRQVGGIVLIVLGLNLMGVLRIPFLARTFRPGQTQFGKQPLGGAAARNPLGAFALGSVFAIGWTPCIGPTLGAILTLSRRVGQPAGRPPARRLLDRPGRALPTSGAGHGSASPGCRAGSSPMVARSS